MKNLKYLLFFTLLIFGSFFLGSKVFTYSSQTTHPYLTEEIAKFFNAYYAPQISEEQTEWLKQGSIEEDKWPRNWFYHFYDPINKRGLGHLSAKEWSEDENEQSRVVGGNHTWQKAIRDYNSGRIKESFVSLGHIIHLIEDMGVPAHTREDPHFALDGGGDPLENWAKALPFDSSYYDVAHFLISQNLKPNILKSLNDYFDEVALYSNLNFFSRDTITDYQKPVVAKEEWQNGRKYALGYLENTSKLIRLAEVGVNIYGNKVYLLDETTPELQAEHFSLLSREIVVNGAGLVKLFFDQVDISQGGFTSEVVPQLSVWEKAFNWVKEKIKFVGNVVEGVWKMPDYALDSIVRSVMPEAKYLVTNPLVAKQVFEENSEVKPPIPPNGGFTSESFSGAEGGERAKGIKVVEEVETTEEVDSIKESPETFLVERVIDGDTILLNNGKRVRLIGVNAPELPNGCFAPEAKIALENLIADQEIKMEKDVSETDDYGRLLRYIYLDSIFVNDYLVRLGYAYDWAYGADLKYQEQLAEAKAEARENGRGLWGEICHPTQVVVAQEEAHQHRPSGGLSPSLTEEVNTQETVSQEIVEETTENDEGEETNTEADEETENEEEIETDINIDTEEVETALLPVVVNEIAWAGTQADHNDEWIELYNPNDYDIGLTGWRLEAVDGSPVVELVATISAEGYFLLERTDDQAISNIEANQTYTGALSNYGEKLVLKNAVGEIVDEVDSSAGWLAGENNRVDDTWQRRSMERVGLDWQTYDGQGDFALDKDGYKILGTPKAENSVSQTDNQDESSTDQTSKPFFVDNNITEDTVWTLKNSPYLVYDGAGQPNELLEIAQGATLTIAKGVIVKFYNPGLKVLGTLRAEGSSDQPIIFTSPNPQTGDWSGIWFEESEAGSVLDNVVIEYAGSRTRPVRVGSQYSPDAVGAAVRVENTSVSIKSSLFKNNLFKSIWLIDSPETVIEDTIFRDNNEYDYLTQNEFPYDRNMAIYLDNSNPQIKSSVFENNLTGIYIVNGSEPVVQYNSFLGNIYPVWVKDSYPVFSGNETEDNHWNGIVIAKLTVDKDYTLGADLPIINYAYPYDGIIVNEGATLTISPGTIIKAVNNTSGIVVKGTLVAEGLPGKFIFFTSFFDDDLGGDTNGDGSASQNQAQRGSWGQIVISETSNNSSFDFATIEFGGNKWLESPANQKDDFVLIIKGAGVLLDHLVIGNNLKGVYIDSIDGIDTSGIFFSDNNVNIEIAD